MAAIFAASIRLAIHITSTYFNTHVHEVINVYTLIEVFLSVVFFPKYLLLPGLKMYV